MTDQKMKIDFFEFVYVWFRLQGLGVPKHQRKIARWLSSLWNEKDQRQGLLMAFRNSGKSTIVGLFCAWILYTKPESRILVIAADHAALYNCAATHVYYLAVEPAWLVFARIRRRLCRCRRGSR